MEILLLTSLTELQRNQILILQQQCIDFDHSGRELFLSNDLNYHKDMPCFILGYQDGTLCGVLVLFAPTMETAEISAFVHPNHRRIGIFTELLMSAWETAQGYQITKLLIVTDAVGSICKKILKKWGASMSRSEYLLVFKGNQEKRDFPFANNCLVREARSSDLEKMVELNMAGFGEDKDNASHMVHENFNHSLTRCFVGIINDEIFGLANVRQEGSGFYICGFLVSSGYRGKGMGRYLLYQILKLVYQRGDEDITLEVDSTNQPAYQLYISSGFAVESQANYYHLELPVL